MSHRRSPFLLENKALRFALKLGGRNAFSTALLLKAIENAEVKSPHSPSLASTDQATIRSCRER
jgi:hypothetical protein